MRVSARLIAPVIAFLSQSLTTIAGFRLIGPAGAAREASRERARGDSG